MGRPTKDPKSVVPKRPKSLVWQHFGDNLDGQHAHCILCKEKGKAESIKINDFSTKALWNHLESFHKEEWRDIKAEEAKIESEKEKAVKKAPVKKDDEGQTKIKEAFNKLTKIDPQGAKQGVYDKLLLEMLADNFIAFEFVNSGSFQRFVTYLDKTFNHKTASTYSKQMSKFAQEVLGDVMEAIEELCDASANITTDLWTSRARDSYIAITVHFVDKLFRLHRWTPFCSSFTDRHTGENIQEVIDMNLEDKLKLPNSLPKWGTSDNASNMIKAINRSIVEFYSCCCHTQQLGINDAFKKFKNDKDGDSMQDVADKCRKLAAHLKRADNSRKLLYAECERTGHNPNAVPIANDTRWDSTHSCMEGVLYHEECLLNMARRGELDIEDSEGNWSNYIPSVENFHMIQAGVKVLKICKITTKIFEQEKVPTIPLVTDRLYTMDQELEEFIKDKENIKNKRKSVRFAEVLRKELQKRFPIFGMDNELNCMGNYLNPVTKGIHLKLVNKFEETKELMEVKVVEWNVVEDDDMEEEDEEVREPPAKLSPTDLLKRKLLQQEEQKEGGSRSSASSIFSDRSESVATSRFRRECRSYEALPYAPSSVDQLNWWKNHQEQFPVLSFMVRIIFAVPCASSKSERVFSVAGNTCTPKRASMGTDTMESCVIVKSNLPLLREMGLKK